MSPSTESNRVLQIGYCTNVHAGADWQTTRQNLENYALAVKQQFRPREPMGVGLWLSQSAAKGLLAGSGEEEFAGWLADQGLVPFTLNGFPQGDFHQPVVKHRVYEPNWFDRARLDYTLDLVTILDRILPAGHSGSISTLPLAWGDPQPSNDQLDLAARHLREVAARLAELETERGRLITLAIEPEPGCVLQKSDDVLAFYRDHLLPGGDEDAVRRYLRICHDVCHAAVMFEDQRDVLTRFHAAGIGIGKVQVSSAVRIPFAQLAADERPAALTQLSGFAEDRYLHQTVRRAADRRERFIEDLPLALSEVDDAAQLDDEWRVHFHVPIYLARFGLLETTQQAILECLAAARELSDVAHFEVETYAWGVLPEELRIADLAAGIAREMSWFETAARA